MIFAGLIILSTCIGVKITSYSLNTRVIGAMSAGLLGGPLVGLYSSGHWSNICTYLLDTESICKRVCICYNFVRTFGSRILSLFSKRQVEIYGSVPVSMFCGNL
ncbi:MAG: LytS/YhcK type 5TM receptor domain-containing protein [Dorea formicigenerans]